MKIRDVMTPDVRTVAPTATIREAAQIMAETDVGALPVADNDRLVGMVTDRDIAVRAVAAGRGADTPVREAMSPEIKYCFEDDDVDDVCENLADQQLRRLPVVDSEKNLVGIVSLSDLARQGDSDAAGEALEGISKPGGQHSQRPVH
ncbi:MAG TPA: CBS domain-containing protein [Candidatus Binatia bacterium]|nr:CBS domain-containing protein [Candidatus Binatia bacterium]